MLRREYSWGEARILLMRLVLPLPMNSLSPFGVRAKRTDTANAKRREELRLGRQRQHALSAVDEMNLVVAEAWAVLRQRLPALDRFLVRRLSGAAMAELLVNSAEPIVHEGD